jgi:sigma-B regulation protein RsbU (phosphoserine phosphatase)
MLLRTRITVWVGAGFAALALLISGAAILRESILHDRLAAATQEGQTALWNSVIDVELGLMRAKIDVITQDGEFALAVKKDDRPSALLALQRAGISAQGDKPPEFAMVVGANREPMFAAGIASLRAVVDASVLDRVLDGRQQAGLRILPSGQPYLLSVRRMTLGEEPVAVILGRSATPALRRFAQHLGGDASLVTVRGMLAYSTAEPLHAQVALGASPRVPTFQEVPVDAKAYMVSGVPVNEISGGQAGSLIFMKDVTASLTGSRQLAQWAMMSAVALVLVGITVLNVLLWRSFRPLQLAINALRALSRGDAHVHLQRGGSDEIGQIADAVVVFRQHAQDLIANRALRERIRRRQESVIQHEIKVLSEATESQEDDKLLSSLGEELHNDRPDDSLRRLAMVLSGMTGRIVRQQQILSSMVVELREALRVKTQYIAIQQELEIAAKMQSAILPRHFVSKNGLSIHASMTPAKEIGGDFYDYFELDQNRVAMIVADVSGKGVPAALFMAVSRTLLRAVAKFSSDPGECLDQLNGLLTVDNEQMMFVTLFYAVIDTRNGAVTFANAGHNPPYLLRKNGIIEAVVPTRGIALAVFDGMDFEVGHLLLEPGDGFFMYTDGVTEAFNPQGDMYGTDRLESLLVQLSTLPVDQVPGRIEADVKVFEAGGPQSDDVTCLMARFAPI